MYSMPQQAVTNGYWKMENFRAQPSAASTRVVIQFNFETSTEDIVLSVYSVISVYSVYSVISVGRTDGIDGLDGQTDVI